MYYGVRCVLYCDVRCSLYYGVHCTLYCDVRYSLCCDVHRALYCAVRCALHCNVRCVLHVMMYFLYYDVLHMSWCIFYVKMYYICCDIFFVMILHMLGHILCIVGFRDSWYIGPIVSDETPGWLIYELTRAYLRRLQHITHSCIHLSAGHLVPDGLPRTSCVVFVYGRHYTRTILCVMHWWEPHVHRYHVIYGGVMYDVYVIYRSYVFTHCKSFYSIHPN